MLTHHLLLAVPAANAILAAVPHIGTVQLPGVFAVIIVTWIFRQLLGWVGRRWLSRLTWWDDAVRVALVFVGYIGPLSTVPAISTVLSALYKLISTFIAGAGWHVFSFVGLSIITLAAAALTGRGYYRRHGRARLIWFVIFGSSLLGLPWLQTATAWYINHLGLPTWNGLLAAWTFVEQLTLHHP